MSRGWLIRSFVAGLTFWGLQLVCPWLLPCPFWSMLCCLRLFGCLGGILPLVGEPSSHILLHLLLLSPLGRSLLGFLGSFHLVFMIGFGILEGVELGCCCSLPPPIGLVFRTGCWLFSWLLHFCSGVCICSQPVLWPIRPVSCLGPF